MNYEAAQVIEALRETRLTKEISQRTLSEWTGLPQAQISRIEAGSVDLRLSSLVAIANALDLQLALVPRNAAPAVQSVIRQTTGSKSAAAAYDAPRPVYSLDEGDDG